MGDGDRDEGAKVHNPLPDSEGGGGCGERLPPVGEPRLSKVLDACRQVASAAGAAEEAIPAVAADSDREGESAKDIGRGKRKAEEQPKQHDPQSPLAQDSLKAPWLHKDTRENRQFLQLEKGLAFLEEKDDAHASAAEGVKEKGKAPAVDESRRDADELNASIIGQGERSARLRDEQVGRLAEAWATLTKSMEIDDSLQITFTPSSKYVGFDRSRSRKRIVLRECMLNVVGHDKYQVCMSGPHKTAVGDTVVYFSEVGIKYEDKSLITQIVSADVIIEELDSITLGKTQELKGAVDRQMGAQYCRLGFPIQDFTKVFHSIAMVRPSVMNALQVSPGHYWAVSGCGVSDDPCPFQWREGGGWNFSYNQHAIHSKFKRRALRSTATVAVSISAPPLVKDSMEYENVHYSIFDFDLLRFTLDDAVDAPPQVQTQIAGSVVSSRDRLQRTGLPGHLAPGAASGTWSSAFHSYRGEN